MQTIISMMEDIFVARNVSNIIKEAGIIPINQDGRQVTCFTDMNVNNAELYDYNVLKKGGNHLLINCWFSPFHCHPKWHLRKIAHASNAVYDCSKCEFCLFDAAGYNMFFSVDERTDNSFEVINEIIDEIEKNLNAPICNITYRIGTKEEIIHRAEPKFERREKPCYKPMNISGIMWQSQSKKAVEARMKKRLSE